MQTERREVVVIGAGPAGAIAAALLRRRGRDVLVLERQRFPRFSIGESLLVHCLDFVAEAGMLDAVDAAGFQFKNGAAFARGAQYGDFDFGAVLAPGRASTYQVERAPFDRLLAEEAARQGAEICYETEIVAADCDADGARIAARAADGTERCIQADFLLDASGFGRTLARLLKLERPSDFPVRRALYCHLADHLAQGAFDRNKILITVHPERRDTWYWVIPFVNGRCSIGVVGPHELIAGAGGAPRERLLALVAEEPWVRRLTAQAEWDTPVREAGGYAANVTAMHGPRFALLGNAAEFLDPVFSSGVTIAMRSASMAAAAVDRELTGASVDWDREFEQPLRVGIDCFRAFVEAWYDGRLQEIFFGPAQSPDIRRMISLVLAGYAWDARNPFVAEPRRRLETLARYCAMQAARPVAS